MSEPAELDRLRAEVAALRTQLDGRARRADALRALRRFAAAFTVMVAAWCTVAALVGVWLANTSLDTDRWVQTVAPLPSDPRVAAAVAEYATTEVFALLDVQERLGEALPPRVAFAAGPITGQVRSYVQNSVEKIVGSERFHTLWVQANRRAHQAVVAIVEARSEVVRAGRERVTVDLLPLINEVLRDLEANLPTLFGRRLNLPDLGSGQIPPDLRARVQSAIGVALPADFAQFTVYDAGRLRAVQVAVVQFKRSVAVLAGAAVVLLALALWVAPRRRRTVMQYGVWLAIGVLAMTGSLRAVRAELLSRVPAGTYRDGVAAAVTTVFAGLRDRGVLLLCGGVLLALVCYLVGPGRLPTLLRRGVRTAGVRAVDLGRGLLRRDAAVGVLGWIDRHRDPLRVAGVLVAGLVSLLLSSWSGLVVVAVVLAAYQILLSAVGSASKAGPEAAPRVGSAPRVG